VTSSLSLSKVEPSRGAPYATPRIIFTPDTCSGGRHFFRPSNVNSLECSPCPAGTINLPNDGLEVCAHCANYTVLIGDSCQSCPSPAVARIGADGIPFCVNQVDPSIIIIVSLVVVLTVFALLTFLRSRAYAKEKAHAKALAQTKAESVSRFTSMLSLVSHELRTPLQLVMLHLDMLESTDPAQTKRILAVSKSCEWLSSVVTTILDACKLNAGILELVSAPFCVRALMHECVEMALPKLGGKQVILFASVETVRTPTEQVMVNADAQRLKQVVLNLLFNAAKYTQSGYIELHVRHDQDGQTVIRVCDTGPGIPQNERGRLYEQFVQADSVSTNVLRGGTGLGLFIAKEVLTLMGGSIDCFDNEGATSGTVFEVVVPLPSAWTSTITPLALAQPRSVQLVIAVGVVVPPLREAYVRCATAIAPDARVVRFTSEDEYKQLVKGTEANNAMLLVLADDSWVGKQRFLECSSNARASVLHLSTLDVHLCDRHWGKRGPTIGCIDHHVDALALKLLIRAWIAESNPIASEKPGTTRSKPTSSKEPNRRKQRDRPKKTGK